MNYEINEVVSEPTVMGYTLEVGGETIATAQPASDIYNTWRVNFGDTGLFAGTINEARARAVLEWLGEKLSPPLTVINGPEELDRAAPGSYWSTEYNGGNRYRKTFAGEWQYAAPADPDGWMPCLGVNNDGPFKAAYPLTAVR